MGYLRVKDVAKLVGLSDKVVYAWRIRQKNGEDIGPKFYDDIIEGMILCEEKEVHQWITDNPRTEPEIKLPTILPRRVGVKYVDAATLGRMFSFSDACMLNWARSGRIPAIKMGGRYRFDSDAVLAALRSKDDAHKFDAEMKSKLIEFGNELDADMEFSILGDNETISGGRSK